MIGNSALRLRLVVVLVAACLAACVPVTVNVTFPPAVSVSPVRCATSETVTAPGSVPEEPAVVVIFGDAFTTTDCSLVSLHLPTLSAKCASSLESKEAIHR